MDGKKVMLFIIAISIVVAILTWVLGQKVIEEQDFDEIETEIVN